MSLLIGADPELFLKRNGQAISAHSLLPGSKTAPYPVPFGAIQVDGTAGEFNIDPADTEDKFVLHISEVMRQLEEMLDSDVELDITPSRHYQMDYMASLPGDAKKLGCDPDFNAYTMDANPKPDEATLLRTAAGHIHIGWGSDFNPHSSDHFETCCLMTKQMDFWNGLPSVILDPDTERKKLYGKAGAFRPKPYGLEYRVCSNFWLKEEGLMRLMYSNAQQAFGKMREGVVHQEKYGDIAQDIINNNDAMAAIELCNEIGIPYWSLA